jgi:hypothetical protein
VTTLVGRWTLVDADQALELEPDAVADFRPDGELRYSVRDGPRTSVMRLSYRVEGPFLITDQASSPREERTEYWFDGDQLVLKYDGGIARFRRA